ncbi:MAG: hypothetical protein R6U68_12380, partial [Desulfobacteraceae bacterium]
MEMEIISSIKNNDVEVTESLRKRIENLVDTHFERTNALKAEEEAERKAAKAKEEHKNMLERLNDALTESEAQLGVVKM